MDEYGGSTDWNAGVDIVVDARCLQDENYRDRGVGRLATNLLRLAKKILPEPNRFQMIGLVDQTLPRLEDRHRQLFDTIRLTAYTGRLRRRTWFIELSPMTHDPLFVARLVVHPHVFAATVVYDFIPLEEADRYLATPYGRLDYHVALLWLARYQLFSPISAASAARLQELLRISVHDIGVIGAPIDASFEEVASNGGSARQRYVLVIGGGDPRKNVECALKAHAHSQMLQKSRVELFITGRYAPEVVANLQNVYRSEGGDPSLVRFVGYLSDRDIVTLYRSTLCVVTPSRAEGFSLPVVEAMCAGVPSFASDIPPHRELIDQQDLLFPPEDDRALRALLDRVVTDEAFRQQVISAQTGRWERFRAEEVARRFWGSVVRHKGEGEPSARAPSARLRRRASIAILAPLPPDRSGVADYTAASIRELGKLVDVHVYTETENPTLVPGAQTIRPLSAFPYLSPDYDRVVSVIGNSEFHLRIFELLMRYGGACIEHDNRLLDFYRILLGEERCRSIAERELGRPLGVGELDGWLADASTLDALFLSEIADVAEPLMLHSRVTAQLVQERYGVSAVHLPFCVFRELPEGALRPAGRQEARQRLGIGGKEIAVVTFGFVHETKAPEECIWALEMLRGWGFPAKLYFVGGFHTDDKRLRDLCKEIDVDRNVVFFGEFADDRTYNGFLAAADLGIQLRTHRLGGLSGALLDCIAAGMPTVANDDLAAAMEAPPYVRRIPDHPSPVLLAEALANLLDEGAHTHRWDSARRNYCQGHNFSAYAKCVLNALELEIPTG